MGTEVLNALDEDRVVIESAEMHGFTLEVERLYRAGELLPVDEGSILAVTHGCVRIELGQLVTSSGKHLVPKGHLGTVVGIQWPYCNGYTDNILRINWGEENSFPDSTTFEGLKEHCLQ